MKKYKSIITIFVMFIIICINNMCYASIEKYQTLPVNDRDTAVQLIDSALRNKYHWNGENTITIEKDNQKYQMKYGDNNRYKVLFYIKKNTLKVGTYIGYIEFEDKLDGSTPDESTDFDLEDPITNPDYYKPSETTGNNTEFINMGNIIIGTMRAFGTAIAVIALMVIGIRYMFGSMAERAAYKETMIPYLIGAVMLFAISNILGIIYDLVKVIQF